MIATTLAEIAEATVEDIFDEGLHEFLTRAIGEISGLALVIGDAYLSGEIA